MKKFIFLVVPILALIGLYVFVSPKTSRSTNKLIVYTYSSFASSWGAGPALKEAFQKESNYEVEFIDVGDAGTLLLRLDIEGRNTSADIVLGLDQFSLKKAQESGLFLDNSLKIENPEKLLAGINHFKFLPYNWSPMVFVYRKSDFKNPPVALSDLLTDKFKNSIVLYDPSSSSPGYIFIHYILDLLGEDKGIDFLSKLKKNVVTVAPSWSAGYGLFTQKNARLAFSYLGSPIYHWQEESNVDYQPLILQEP